MTGTMETLLTIFAITCAIRLLLELRFGQRKLWSYLLKQNGPETAPSAPFSLLIAALALLILLGVLPESVDLFLLYTLAPLLLSLAVKSWQLTAQGKRQRKEKGGG